MDPTNDDLSDYDVISELGNRSPESSVADLGQIPEPTEKVATYEEAAATREPPPSQEAKEKFKTASLAAKDIQTYVAQFLELETWPKAKAKATRGEERLGKIRVYVDGQFDGFHAGDALQFRQAKLSFPNVHLMIGVFGDELCEIYESPSKIPHVERCEVIRHCRWVDEVIADAPWAVDEEFVAQNRVDFVVLNEGISADPKCDKIRLGGYDAMKKLGTPYFAVPTSIWLNEEATPCVPLARSFDPTGKTIPTRRTIGLGSSEPHTQTLGPTPSEAFSHSSQIATRWR